LPDINGSYAIRMTGQEHVHYLFLSGGRVEMTFSMKTMQIYVVDILLHPLDEGLAF
jgi:hypothetical protein